MDQSALSEFDRLIQRQTHEQDHAAQARILQIGLSGVDDEALNLVTAALKKSIPARVHNPFAAIDPTRAMHEAVYSGKHLLVMLLDAECQRRKAPRHPDHIK